ncbi:MAG: cyclic nucleotide-binding domain-containing protein [Alphaproteobacteria bacterium]|nr:cyclic nucleotide-binding domain-containing protein [Alphaproteobacteria bacterium]
MQPALAEIPFLANVAPAALTEAEAEATWFSVPAGWPLFRQGEAAECVYFVMSGALAAFRIGPNNEQILLGYIRSGEPVGEMGLIARAPHAGSVFAMRDSEIVRLSRKGFEILIRAEPTLMERMARLMLSRAREPQRVRPRAEPKVYALIGTSPTIDLRLRARTLQAALARLGKTAAIVGDEGAEMQSVWFDALEHKHDAVFLISPIADTSWFRACIRQADRIWVLARADARPSTPLLPEEDPSPARQFRFVDVILLHHGMDRQAATTEEWRAACDAARLFHWRGLDDPDAARLARVVAGRSIGLVLSGGGARAYAHIGVVRALREAGVPFDVVGGTSMGGIIAACVAMGWDDEEIEVRIRKGFVESNPLGDYVMPVVSLVRGKRVEDRLREHFGETLIEDLQVPFFCVSTNLAAGATRVHRTGLLRQALRASIALPGILPPVVDGKNGLLVDGAVMKNFPVDILKDMHRGQIIGVDVAQRQGIDPEDFMNPPGFFGWIAAHGLQSPPPIASLLMRAATLMVDPWEGRQGVDMLVAPDMPNVDLRDWKKFDEAVVAGYEECVAVLKKQPEFFAPPPPDPFEEANAEILEPAG